MSTVGPTQVDIPTGGLEPEVPLDLRELGEECFGREPIVGFEEDLPFDVGVVGLSCWVQPVGARLHVGHEVPAAYETSVLFLTEHEGPIARLDAALASANAPP